MDRPEAGHPEFGRRDLGALRKAYYGASIMPVPVLERLRARLPGLGFYNCFGQSEIGPLATVLGPGEHEGRLESCGRPVRHVEAKVVDERGEEVPAGTADEVVYRSPQLCLGYWNDPEATREAFRDGWFRSGDLAVRDAEGYFTVVDRLKDVINSGGVLVASRQVEDVLYGHPGVAEAAVIGLPDERWIEAVTAVVVARGEVAEADLLAHARKELAHFKAPKRVLFVEALPRNASGKILKRELRERFMRRPGRTRLTAGPAPGPVGQGRCDPGPWESGPWGAGSSAGRIPLVRRRLRVRCSCTRRPTSAPP